MLRENDGIIFIDIDHYELFYLGALADEVFGYNNRLDPLQALILSEKLKMLDSNNKSTSNLDSKFETDERITLELLSTVDLDSKITQRSIAAKLGIALGLTNTYLKRCADKGLVKIKQVPRNRYAYFLTPRGFSEKARLTAEYFKASFHFFRKSKEDCEQIILNCPLQGHYKIFLSDISELAEIFILSAIDSKIEILGIYDNRKKIYSGIKVFRGFKDSPKHDVVILTAIANSQNRYQELLTIYKKNEIIIPKTLNIKR